MASSATFALILPQFALFRACEYFLTGNSAVWRGLHWFAFWLQAKVYVPQS